MKKKLLCVLMAAALVLGMAACSGGNGESKTDDSQTAESTDESDGGKITSLDQLEGKTIAINSVPMSEEHLRDVMLKQAYGVTVGDILVVPTVSESIMLLDNGKADAAMTALYSTAKYYADKNDGLTAMETLLDSQLSMIVKDDSGLLDELNGAVAELKDSGKLDELVKTWIDDVDLDNIQVEEVPKIDGADTIKVGVSGDIPPLDYITADGKPAGFNIALMTEISKIINKNIEFVSMDTGNKFAAVTSGKVDVFFWHLDALDLPEGVAHTDYYYVQKTAIVVKK